MEFLAYDAAGDLVFNDWDDTAPYSMETMEVPEAGDLPDRGARPGTQEYLTATAVHPRRRQRSPAAGGGGPGSRRPHVHGRAWVSASSSSGESCWSEDQPEMVLA